MCPQANTLSIGGKRYRVSHAEERENALSALKELHDLPEWVDEDDVIVLKFPWHGRKAQETYFTLPHSQGLWLMLVSDNLFKQLHGLCQCKQFDTWGAPLEAVFQPQLENA